VFLERSERQAAHREVFHDIGKGETTAEDGLLSYCLENPPASFAKGGSQGTSGRSQGRDVSFAFTKPDSQAGKTCMLPGRGLPGPLLLFSQA